MTAIDLDALLTEADGGLAFKPITADELDSYLSGARPGDQELSVMVPVHVLARAVAALRSVQVPVTEEWLEEHVIGVLDDESHEDVCSCGDWPESCVTYGIRRPWSHDASRAIEYIARNFTVLPSPGTTTEEE